MPQVCSMLSDESYEEVQRRARIEGKSMSGMAAALIEYSLHDANEEISTAQQNATQKERLIQQLNEELGFLRSSYSTLLESIARPLTHLLTEGDVGPPKKEESGKKGWRFWKR